MNPKYKVEGDDSPRTVVLLETDRFELVRLADGRYQLTVLKDSGVVRHAATLAQLKLRLQDAGPDAAAILALLPK